MSHAISAEKFAQGMTYDEYVAFIGTPENLQRPGSSGQRQDLSGFFRDAFEQSRLTEDQAAALNWLVAQPNGPAKMLAICEDWSSDVQRDLPVFGRIAAESGMELRIFLRDGQEYDLPAGDPDIMADFLNRKDGEAYRSIPVCAFYTKDFEYLYHFTEYAALYDKERVVVQAIRAPRAGEAPEQTQARAASEFGDLRQTPFWRIWTSGAVDEIITMLHRKLTIGTI